jgi:hypothetical protein
VDDPARVRGLEGISQLETEADDVAGRNDPGTRLVQRRSLEKFQNEIDRRRFLLGAAMLADVVQGADVRVVQGGDEPRLLLKPLERIATRRTRGEHLDRDLAVQPCVARTIHLAHAASAERRNDFIGSQTTTGDERHACLLILPVRLLRAVGLIERLRNLELRT